MTEPLDAFSASQACTVATRTVKLECHAVVPLCICHLKKIDLRHGTGDVDQGIYSAKALESAFNDYFAVARDLWRHQDVGILKQDRTVIVPADGVILLRLSKPRQ